MPHTEPRARFYRWSLLAPLVVPVAIGLPVTLLRFELLAVPALFVAGSLAYTWWTYPFFALAVAWWARRKDALTLQRAAWVFPLLYAPFSGLAMGMMYGRPMRGAPVTFWDDFAWGMLLALLFGYSYVLVVRAVGALIPLRRPA